MKNTLYSTVALCAVISATQTQAQDGPVDLGQLILSGGLTPIEAEAYGRAVSVVTGAELEERGITTIQDALRAVPGVAVSSTGGNSTSVRIRGGEANHTLILIDGVEAAGGGGEYFLSGLEAINIERVEVLRGPQSVFFGSNASAGVINIITRKGDLGSEKRFSIEGGGGFAATGFYSRRDERGGFALSFSETQDFGWDFSDSGGEKDATDRRTIALSGDYMVTPNLQLGFGLRDSQENFDFDSTDGLATTPEGYVVDDTAQFSNRNELTASLFAELTAMDGRMTHRLTVEKTDSDQSFNGFAPTENSTDAIEYRLSFGLDGQTVANADQILNLLIERQEDKTSANPDFSIVAESVALEYRGSFSNGLDLQAGVRQDFNDPFENATTWNLGAAYTLASGVRLHGSAGTGVVNPTFFELFASAFGFTGNPDLQPEENVSFDLGVEFPVLDGRGTVDVTYFNERLTNEITSVSTGPGTFSFENQAGESTREGVEVSSRIAATDNLDLRASYTYLDARNPDGSVETRRPQHEVSLGATFFAFEDRATFSADLRHVAGNLDTQFFGGFATVELPTFTTVDVAARYAISDTVTLTGRVENVFDSDASEVWGYVGRPRTIYVGLDAQF